MKAEIDLLHTWRKSQMDLINSLNSGHELIPYDKPIN